MDGSVELKPIYGPGFEAAIDREVVRQAGELGETKETNKRIVMLTPTRQVRLSEITDYRWIKDPGETVGKTIAGLFMARRSDFIVVVFADRSFMTIGQEDGKYDFGRYLMEVEVIEQIFSAEKSPEGHVEVRFTELATLLDVDKERIRGGVLEDYERAAEEQKRLEYEQFLRLKERYEGPGRP